MFDISLGASQVNLMWMRLLVGLLVGLGLAGSVLAEVVAVEVHGGARDRVEVLCEFALPAFKGHTLALKMQDSTRLPLQVDDRGQAMFVLPKLAKDRSVFLELDVTGTPTKRQVLTTRKGRKLRLEYNGNVIAEYQAEAADLPREGISPLYRRGGYLHPVFTPKGKLVTDDFPLQHTHHHGIWFPWTNARFEERKPDFWNMGSGTGRVDFVKLDKTWSGPVHGGFRAVHRFEDLIVKPAKAVLQETWEVRVFALTGGAQPKWIFDLTSTQTCAGPSPLVLPQYRYGGLGVRGNRAWDHAADNPTRFLTANGVSDRQQAHATRARWCYLGGQVEGTQAGLAILGHPNNFRAPQPMRVHPKEPFFNFAPQQFGDMAIQPNRPYVSRYRFVTLDGAPDAAELAKIWENFANPPQVNTIEK